MRKIILFLISFFASLPFWYSVNFLQANVEEQLLARELNNNPVSLIANLKDQYPNFKYSIKASQYSVEKECPDLLAQSAVLALVAKDQAPVIVYQKNLNAQKPIASITKLLTALVANDFLKDDQLITISDKAISQADETGLLKPQEQVSFLDLSRMMLIESSNDAAFAVSEAVGEQDFMSAMNIKAQGLGMVNSYFFNPSGLDSPMGVVQTNYSTARDLVILARNLLAEPKILDILAQKEYLLYVGGVFHHNILTTNELLGAVPEIIGGKTGTTDLAGGCLLEIAKTQNEQQYLVSVVLNSTDRFGDTKKLLNCFTGFTQMSHPEASSNEPKDLGNSSSRDPSLPLRATLRVDSPE
jgi:D-alanyl-D-alanine carboxypeptidase (penicillin-binding protein 5/6)